MYLDTTLSCKGAGSGGSSGKDRWDLRVTHGRKLTSSSLADHSVLVRPSRGWTCKDTCDRHMGVATHGRQCAATHLCANCTREHAHSTVRRNDILHALTGDIPIWRRRGKREEPVSRCLDFHEAQPACACKLVQRFVGILRRYKVGHILKGEFHDAVRTRTTAHTRCLMSSNRARRLLLLEDGDGEHSTHTLPRRPAMRSPSPAKSPSATRA